MRMISGDNKFTAIDCALKTGILSPDEVNGHNVVMIGKDFRDLVGGVKPSKDKNGEITLKVEKFANFKTVAKTLKVLARATPADKLTMVVGLKELGNAVAMTADGINDVEALRNANVGICMGITGCDAAKEASDMIILDDDIKSVYKAVQWGRNMHANIRKFI